MGVISSILSSLGGIAASFGINLGIEKIEERLAEKRGVRSTDILNVVKDLTDKVSKLGSNKLAQLDDKLASLNLPFSSSNKVKSYLSEAKRKIRAKQNTINNDIVSVTNRANQIQNNAAALASTSAGYRISGAGRREIDDLKADTKDLIDQVNRVDKSINDK